MKYISMSELHSSGRIYWIKSLSTLREWIKRDLITNNILNTKIVENSHNDKYQTGTRYYIPDENVDKFINAFNDNILWKKSNKNSKK